MHEIKWMVLFWDKVVQGREKKLRILAAVIEGKESTGKIWRGKRVGGICHAGTAGESDAHQPCPTCLVESFCIFGFCFSANSYITEAFVPDQL